MKKTNNFVSERFIVFSIKDIRNVQEETMRFCSFGYFTFVSEKYHESNASSIFTNFDSEIFKENYCFLP